MMTDQDQSRVTRARLDDLIGRHPMRWSEDVVELARVYATAVGAIDDWASWLDEASGPRRGASAAVARSPIGEQPHGKTHTVVRVTVQGRLALNANAGGIARSLTELLGQAPLHVHVISGAHQTAVTSVKVV